MPKRKLNILAEITQAAISALALQEALPLLADRMGALLEADACYLTLWDPKQPPLPMAAAVADAGQAVVISDPVAGGYLAPDQADRHPGARTLLALPLTAADRLLGAAVLLFDTARTFSDRDLAPAEQAAGAIALAVSRLQQQEQERSRRPIADISRTTSSEMNATLDMETLLDRLLDLMAQVVPYDAAAFLTVADGDRLRPARWRGQRPAWMGELGVEEHPLLRRLVSAKRPLVIPDRSADPASNGLATAAAGSWAGVPVFVQGELFGIFTLEKEEAGQYGPEHRRRLEAFAGQATLALANAHLHAATRRQLEELAILHAISVAGTIALSEDELIEQATDIIGNTLYPDNFGLLMYDGKQQVLRPHSSYRPASVLGVTTVVPVDQGVAGHVFTTGRSRRLADVHQVAEYLAVDHRTRSELCVPLKVDDRVIGVINTESTRLNAFTGADEQLLTTLASSLAIAIERLRLFASERSRRQEAETLQQAIAAVTSSLELNQVLDSILVQLHQVVPFDSAALMLQEEDRLRLVAGRGFPSELVPDLIGHDFPADDPLLNELRRFKRPIYLPDARTDRRFQGWGGTSYVRGWMGLPLIARDRLLGYMTVDHRQVDPYQPSDVDLAQSFAHQAATAIENARLYDAARRARQTADRQARELQFTADILRALNATAVVDEAFAEVAAVLRQATGCQRTSLFLLDAESQQQGTLVALDRPYDTLAAGTRLRLEDTAAAADVMDGRLHVTPDLATEREFGAEHALYRAGFRSRVNLPLTVGRRIQGSLNLAWEEAGHHVERQLPWLQQIATALALAVERNRLFSEINRRTAEREILINISSSLRRAGSVNEMLPHIIDTIRQISDVYLVSILLLDQESGDLVVRQEYPPDLHPEPRRVPPGEGVTGHVARTGKPYMTADLANDPLVHVLPEEEANLQQVGGSITLPLQTQERTIGVIHLRLPRGQAPPDANSRLLVAIAEVASSALDRAVVLENLEQRVTERTRELAEANRRLQELDRLKSKFVSDVSHELRTPITNLQLYLDLLEKGPADKQGQYLGVLQQQADRLSSLIEDILNLSRLEIGGERVQFAPVGLNEIINQIVAAHLPRIETSGLAARTQLQPDLPPVEGERNQLAQVVTNLLGNAIRYTLAGHILVSTSWHPETSEVCLAVTDTGIGVHPDETEYLFDRFYRGQHTGQSNIPGTGLGLAIVKEIVDLHGGRITVQSELGRGSTFAVWLPASAPAGT